MAEITNNSINSNNNTQSVQNGLSVGNLYIDQYNERNDPLNGVQFSGRETPATVKDVEEIVSAIKDSFANYIEIQRAYIDSDRAESSIANEEQNSGNELPKKDSEQDSEKSSIIDKNTENSDINEENISNNDKNNEISSINDTNSDSKSDLTQRSKNDIINLNEDSKDIPYEITKSNLTTSQDALQPSFEVNSLISDKILENNDLDTSSLDDVIGKNNIFSNDEIINKNIVSPLNNNDSDTKIINSENNKNDIDYTSIIDGISDKIIFNFHNNKEDDDKNDDISMILSNKEDVSDIKDNQADIFSISSYVDDNIENNEKTSNLISVDDENTNINDIFDINKNDNEDIGNEQTIIKNNIDTIDDIDIKPSVVSIEPSDDTDMMNISVSNGDYDNVENDIENKVIQDEVANEETVKDDESIFGKISGWFSDLFKSKDDNIDKSGIINDEVEKTVQSNTIKNSIETEDDDIVESNSIIDYNREQYDNILSRNNTQFNENPVSDDEEISESDKVDDNDEVIDMFDLKKYNSREDDDQIENYNEIGVKALDYNDDTVIDSNKIEFPYDEENVDVETPNTYITENISTIEHTNDKLIENISENPTTEGKYDTAVDNSNVNAKILSILNSISDSISENNSIMLGEFSEIKNMIKSGEKSSDEYDEEIIDNGTFDNSKQNFDLERIG